LRPPTGRDPHVVPVCFALSRDALYITIDEKPKRGPATALKRLRNIAENPAVAVITDRYDEDWARLGWVMLRGRAEILAEEPSTMRRRRCSVSATRN
jgi:PPOX class probable F420-dependent enzyme